MQAYKPHADAAADSLKLALTEISKQINDYPTPISGCDAQFNHLLADRTKLEAALRALGADVFIPTPRTLNPGDPVESR